MATPRQSRTGRVPAEQYSTPSSAGTSDSESLSEDSTGPNGSMELVPAPSPGALQKSRVKQKPDRKEPSEAKRNKTSDATRQLTKKRIRDDDEDSSFGRERKRHQQAGNSQTQKGKGIGLSPFLISQQEKIMQREKDVNELW
jgi:hypothetical protein